MRKGELTQERIVKSAMRAFGKNGYHETSLDQIAKAAGVQRQSIINYFEDKTGLFRICVLRIITEFAKEYEARTPPGDTAKDRLNRQFEMNLEMALEKGERARLILLLYFNASHEPRLRKIYQEAIVRIRTRYQEIIEAGIQEGLFQPIEDTAAAGSVLHELIVGMILLLFSSSQEEKEVEFVKKKWAWTLSTFSAV